jgi:hypothetical protein
VFILIVIEHNVIYIIALGVGWHHYGMRTSRGADGAQLKITLFILGIFTCCGIDHSENVAWLGRTKIVLFPNIRILPRVSYINGPGWSRTCHFLGVWYRVVLYENEMCITTNSRLNGFFGILF